jgi:hypothetical protein
MKLKLQINPVTLKELRQLVRSRIILWGMVALPIVLLIAMIIVLSDDMHGMSPMEVMYGNGLGEGPLNVTTLITAIVTCGLIPLFTCIKTMIETSRTNERLEFTTALTSSQIASGKIAAAAIISAIAVALAMPFFALSYLMRGIELSTTVAIPALLLLGGTATTALGLLPACARRSIVWKILLLILLGVAVWLFLALVVAVTNIGNSGEVDEIVASILLSLAGAFAAVFLPAATTAYCRAQAAAELAPLHTDFNRPLRITQLVVFAASVPLVFAVDRDGSMLWGIAWIAIAGMIALCAGFSPTPVTRGAILHSPRSKILRVLAFPFATGSVPSMTFAILLATAAAAVMALRTYSTSDFDGAKKFIVFTYECGAVAIAAGALARMSLAGNARIANVIGKIGLAYIVIANLLIFLAEVHVVSEAALVMVPCCLVGVVQMFEVHVPIAVAMGVGAVVLLFCAAGIDFTRWWKAPTRASNGNVNEDKLVWRQH